MPVDPIFAYCIMHNTCMVLMFRLFQYIAVRRRRFYLIISITGHRHWTMGERSQMGHDEETWPGRHHWMMGERSHKGHDEEETWPGPSLDDGREESDGA